MRVGGRGSGPRGTTGIGRGTAIPYPPPSKPTFTVRAAGEAKDDGLSRSQLSGRLKPEYKKNRAQSVAQFFLVHHQGVWRLRTTEGRLRLSLRKVNSCRLKGLFTTARSAGSAAARPRVPWWPVSMDSECERTRLRAGLSTSWMVMGSTRQQSNGEPMPQVLDAVTRRFCCSDCA